LDFRLSTVQEICQVLAQRLKTQRLYKNIKQEELAGRANISVGTVKNLEAKGQASLETWIRVLMALDLTQELESLFTFKSQSISDMEKLEKLKLRKSPRRAR
jgi:transcriptional regulator with XRE-family HTH domain